VNKYASVESFTNGVESRDWENLYTKKLNRMDLIRGLEGKLTEVLLLSAIVGLIARLGAGWLGDGGIEYIG
jgi:hypothetical protein